jgi:hypothetical protein
MIGFWLTSGRAQRRRCTSTFELLVTLAVVTAALLDPFQSAIRIGGFVGIVLIKAGMHAGFAGGDTAVGKTAFPGALGHPKRTELEGLMLRPLLRRQLLRQPPPRLVRTTAISVAALAAGLLVLFTPPAGALTM